MTQNFEVDEMLDNIITREEEPAITADIHAGNRNGPKYHSLMGHN